MPQVDRPAGVLVLYSGTIFVNAALLFTVELLFGKLVLPMLGGTSAVWSTCMMFYQAVLLGGYLYAHVAVHRFGVRRAAALHLLVFSVACVTLPIGIPDGWSPPSIGTPVPWLLGLLTIALGLPFFTLSAGAPLLQRWYADASDGADPYALYAASNAGSLLALLAYPAVIEPSIALSQQAVWWSIGFVVLLMLLFLCALALWRRTIMHSDATTSERVRSEPAQQRLTNGEERARWLLLSAIPSTLLLSVTAHLSTDVAPLPLLWVVPLALYLLTFIVAFGTGAQRVPSWLAPAARLLAIPIILVTALRAQLPMVGGLVLHLVAFGLLALLCHVRLASARPSIARLTEYFTWVSAGGLLGGTLNVLVAPLVFDAGYEYPLGLVAGLAVAAAPSTVSRSGPLWVDVCIALAIGLGLVCLRILLETYAGVTELLLRVLLFVPAGVALIAVSESRTQTVLVGLAVLAASLTSDITAGSARTLERTRSFYGNYVVRATRGASSTASTSDSVHQLVHGSTLHGVQRLARSERRQALSYYARSGPVGDAFTALPARVTSGLVAVVGLGAGTLACYAQPGSQWTFYEVDPVIARIARDTSYFSFLSDCTPSAHIVLGDARLALSRTPDGSLGLLVLDAFTSDAIPVHLLTREALQLYAAKLRQDGVLLIHVSNRYLDLVRVVAGTSRAASLVGVTRASSPSSSEQSRGVSAAQWIALGTRLSNLGALATRPGWRPLPQSEQLWTDDYSNLLNVIRR